MKFRPCPFCGRIPTEDDLQFQDDEYFLCDYQVAEYMTISCTCGIWMQLDIGAMLYDEAVREIKTRWNQRVVG